MMTVEETANQQPFQELRRVVDDCTYSKPIGNKMLVVAVTALY
jgi:hypothetical protein